MSEQSRPDLDQLAAAPIDDEDVRVLRQLAGVYEQLDPVPTGLVDRIQFGITLDALHAEIAELQRSAGLVGVRAETAPPGSQTVTFTSSDLTTMVTITPTLVDRVRVDGWVVPGEGVDVELRVPGGSLHARADEDGRFVFDDVPRGMAQFVLRRSAADRRPVVTPSIEL
jgi:hypothetical protein